MRRCCPARTPVTLGEGMTPLIHARRLGAELGLERLFVKEEGQNPTNSFKARGISAAVTAAKGLGVTTIALPTAGNAGGAAAAYAAAAGLGCVIAMPADTPIAIVLESRACGADVRLIDGLISDCGAFIAAEAPKRGWFEISTLKEPYRIEGKKTMGYELWEEMEGALPDVIVYPTGGGVGLIGMWKAFEELEAMGRIGSQRPRMIAAQAEGCAPIVRAFEQRAAASEKWEGAATVAAGLRVPKALGDFLILADIYASHGEAVAASDAALMAACRDLARTEGIFAAPEGGAGLAAIKTLVAQGKIARARIGGALQHRQRLQVPGSLAGRPRRLRLARCASCTPSEAPPRSWCWPPCRWARRRIRCAPAWACWCGWRGGGWPSPSTWP